MPGRLRPWVWALALAMAGPAALAQSSGQASGQSSGQTSGQSATPSVPALPQSPILTVDQERLYAQSLWGQRVEAELQAETRALQTENNRIEAELTAEEKSLTEKRPTMAPQDFRKLADDFDERVTGIRAAQDRKAADLVASRDRARQEFLAAALPVMAKVLSEHGAVAILDNRAVFVAARSVDATDALLKELDEALGAGPAPAPSP